MNEADRAVVEAFHKLYYPVHRTYWRGVMTVKCAQDLMIYQEIIHETRPDIVVECGVNEGGTTLFLADILHGAGDVIGCDLRIENCDERVRDRPNVSLVAGDSTAPETIAKIDRRVRGLRTMVILDSDHDADHVLQECRAYGPLVSPGCYLIVEDTNLNGNPVVPEHGPGPAEAVRRFLEETNDFEVDTSRERLLLTFNPGGYLKKR